MQERLKQLLPEEHVPLRYPSAATMCIEAFFRRRRKSLMAISQATANEPIILACRLRISPPAA